MKAREIFIMRMRCKRARVERSHTRSTGKEKRWEYNSGLNLPFFAHSIIVSIEHFIYSLLSWLFFHAHIKIILHHPLIDVIIRMMMMMMMMKQMIIIWNSGSVGGMNISGSIKMRWWEQSLHTTGYFCCWWVCCCFMMQCTWDWLLIEIFINFSLFIYYFSLALHHHSVILTRIQK